MYIINYDYELLWFNHRNHYFTTRHNYTLENDYDSTTYSMIL